MREELSLRNQIQMQKEMDLLRIHMRIGCKSGIIGRVFTRADRKNGWSFYKWHGSARNWVSTSEIKRHHGLWVRINMHLHMRIHTQIHSQGRVCKSKDSLLCGHIFLFTCRRVFLFACGRIFLPTCRRVFLFVCGRIFLFTCILVGQRVCFKDKISDWVRFKRKRLDNCVRLWQVQKN